MATAPSADFLLSAAAQSTYVGSIEHKTYKSPAGDPRPRHDAAKCPRLEAERWSDLTEALRLAIRSGCVSDSVDTGGFPRYVWGKFEGKIYEARHLSVPEDGYKAFPIEEFELPDGALTMLEATHDDA